MNHDEFAFFNQQLAGMLRDGIPLEGSLKQLSDGMKDATLQNEIRLLSEDLSRGTPLKDALSRRNLPPLYSWMVDVGARSNDLPGVLTLLADHYQRAGALWNRLKGLLVYPLIVVIVSLLLTLILSFVCSHFLSGFRSLYGPLQDTPDPTLLLVSVWIPPFLFAVACVLGLIAISRPSWRDRLRWRLPGFREASLAQLASALALMLRKGLPLPDALAMAQALEINSPASAALTQWRDWISSGQGKPAQWPERLHPLPPLFLWLVRRSGEYLAAGLQKAAEFYHARASHRIELALYGALPVSVLVVGIMVVWQIAPLMRALTVLLNALGGSFE